MDLFLHIGTEKTGTTTLQNFLALNRGALAGAGFFVPRSLGADNHRILPVLAYNDDFTDDFLKHQGLLDPAARREARQTWQAAFDRDIAGSDAHTALISSEHLQSRLRHPEEVDRLHAILAPRFDRITVVIYLRDPFATAVSLLSTGIKYGGLSDQVPPPDAPYIDNLVNHRATLERWGAVFGRDNLDVRLFDRAAMTGHDLISDFCAACGLPDGDYDRPERLNETLSGPGMALLSRVNRLVPVFLPDDTPNPARRDIAGVFARHFIAGPAYTGTAAARARYQAAFAGSNEWVRQNFFATRDQLFAPAPESEPETTGKTTGKTTADLPGDDLDRIAALIAEIWAR